MDTAIRETKIHGSIEFPYACFSGRIPEYFGEFPIHWHEYFEIVFIVKGTMNVVIGEKRFSPHKGDIIIIPPKCIHGFFRNNEESCFYYTILFRLGMLEIDDNSPVYKKYFVPYEKGVYISETWVKRNSDFSNDIFPAVTYLIRHRHERYTTDELMIKSKLYELLYYFNKKLVLEDDGGGQHIYETRIKPVFSYIHKNFSKTIAISEIAAIAGYSKCHFMSMFKKITGYTFIEYLNIIRIENARKLLVETDSSVSEIAWQSGFNNLSYFIRLFRKNFDCSPLKYRNNSKKM